MILQETKIREIRLKDLILNLKPHYEVVAQDSKGSAIGISILWNPIESTFECWVNMPQILLGNF